MNTSLLEVPSRLAYVFTRLHGLLKFEQPFRRSICNNEKYFQNIRKVELVQNDVYCSEWAAPHTDQNIAAVTGDVPLVNLNLRLPTDINAFPFSKFAELYFKVSCATLFDCEL